MKILPWRIMGPTPQYYVFHLLKTPENSDKAKQLLFLHLSNTLYAPGMVLGPEIFLSTNRQTEPKPLQPSGLYFIASGNKHVNKTHVMSQGSKYDEVKQRVLI